MDKIAASIVYDILIKAGAEETAKAFQSKIPSCTQPIPYSSRLVKKITTKSNENGIPNTTNNQFDNHHYDEDFIVLEAMVKYAVNTRNNNNIISNTTKNTKNNVAKSLSNTNSLTVITSESNVNNNITNSENTNISDIVQKTEKLPVLPSANSISVVTTSTLPSVNTTVPVTTTTDVVVEPWTQEELNLFNKALVQYPNTMDTNARFRAIATVVETRSKRECYDKYKELELKKSESTNSQILTSTITATSTSATASSSSLWEDISNNTSVNNTFTQPTSVDNNNNSSSDTNVNNDIDYETISLDNTNNNQGSINKSTYIPDQTTTRRSKAAITSVIDIDDDNTSDISSTSNKPVSSLIQVVSQTEKDPPDDTLFKPVNTSNISKINSMSIKEPISTNLSTEPIKLSHLTPPTIIENIPSLTTSDSLWEDINVPIHNNSNNVVSNHSNQSSNTIVRNANNNADDLVEEEIEISSSYIPSSRNITPSINTKPVLPNNTFTNTNNNTTSLAIENTQFIQSVIKTIPVQAITYDQVAQLRMALHGQYPTNTSTTPSTTGTTQVQALRPEWLLQSLQFSNETGLRYGLLQTKGGPCGPLACINGETVRHLYYSPLSTYASTCTTDSCASKLYNDITSNSTNLMGTLSVSETYSSINLDPTDTYRNIALIYAISDIIWRCRPNNTSSATVAIFDETLPRCIPQVLQLRIPNSNTTTIDNNKSTPMQVSFNSDGITERLRLYTCTNQQQIIALIEQNLSIFMRDNGPGLTLVLYSAVLTRGITNMIQDMIESNGGTIYGTTSLLGSYGYASQELVNLLLTGRATTYTFNGKQIMDNQDTSTNLTLYGIEKRSSVGFLSVLHTVGYMDVGTNYLEPYTPVWVVFGESHYSILFAAPLYCQFPIINKKRYTFGRKIDPLLINGPDSKRCIGIQAVQSSERISCKSFDIIYWDGLARQDELYRLTVNLPISTLTTINNTSKLPTESELSAIELWLWSKYPMVKIMWNDIDPWEPLRITPDYLPKYPKRK